MTLTTRKMSDRHEEFLADLLSGRRTRGSGNQFNDQTDGKQAHGSGAFVFAWDGKATLGKSIGVTREMWTKLVEQAGTYLPALPLRFYRDERLTRVDIDLIAVEATTFAEMQAEANTLARIRESGCLTGTHYAIGIGTVCTVCKTDLSEKLRGAR